MLTMDMILTKKKRIAVDKRRNKPTNTSSGLWGMISSVTHRPAGSESKFTDCSLDKFHILAQ